MSEGDFIQARMWRNLAVEDATEKDIDLVNNRRVDLIEKQYASVLSKNEALELEELQDFMGRYADHRWPFPFEKLEELEDV